jgi:hypothetical protein
VLQQALLAAVHSLPTSAAAAAVAADVAKVASANASLRRLGTVLGKGS